MRPSRLQSCATSIVSDVLGAEGRTRTYRLHVLSQPVANPDAYTIEIEPPKGWRAQGETTYSGNLTGDVIMEVRLTQTWRAWLFQKTVLDPWRVGRRLVGRIF